MRQSACPRWSARLARRRRPIRLASVPKTISWPRAAEIASEDRWSSGNWPPATRCGPEWTCPRRPRACASALAAASWRPAAARCRATRAAGSACGTWKRARGSFSRAAAAPADLCGGLLAGRGPRGGRRARRPHSTLGAGHRLSRAAAAGTSGQLRRDDDQRVRDRLQPRRLAAGLLRGRRVQREHARQECACGTRSAARNCRRSTAHHKPVFSVAFSPCGGRMASASGDQTVRLWNAKTGEAVRTLQSKDMAQPPGRPAATRHRSIR